MFGGRAADGSPRVLRVAAEAISAFNFLQSTLYGMDAIATDEHGFSRIIAIAVLNHEWTRMFTNRSSWGFPARAPRCRVAFQGCFLTTEDPEVTEEETAGRWYCFVSPFSFLAAPLYGKDAIAPHPRRLSPVPGRGENLVASCQFLVFSYGAFLRVFASSRETNRS